MNRQPFDPNMSRAEYELATAKCVCQSPFFKPVFPQSTHAKSYIVCVCCGKKIYKEQK
jgi:hypothetical protein